jgi:hypothetical protein
VVLDVVVVVDVVVDVVVVVNATWTRDVVVVDPWSSHVDGTTVDGRTWSWTIRRD